MVHNLASLQNEHLQRKPDKPIQIISLLYPIGISYNTETKGVYPETVHTAKGRLALW